MSNERLLTKEQTAHKIDTQLYWESLTTLALAEGNLTIDEYEAHKDAHLDEILALFSDEAEIVRAETLRKMGEELSFTYDMCIRIGDYREFADEVKVMFEALKRGEWVK